MAVVWELGRATVRDVYERLRERRRLAYTTVMTVMTLLEAKGHLKRTPAGRAYVYESARERQQVLRDLVGEFVDRVFGGAAAPLVSHLVEDRRLTEEELEEIARRVREVRR